MPDSDVGRLMQRAIGDWTSQLMDLTGNNTLLNFRDLKAGSLDLAEASDVAQGEILSGTKVSLSEAFVASHADAAKRARAIAARAEENFEEKGLDTLSIGWGMVTWANPDSYTPNAPILLCGAELKSRGSAGEDFELRISGEWEINPTLLHVLASNFDVRVNEDALLDLLELHEDSESRPNGGAVFERLVKEAEGRVDGFALNERLVLANFSYARLPMVRDIAAAAHLLSQSDLLCAIAGDAGALDALRVEHGNVTSDLPDFTPPADEFLVLDADSSQSFAINSVVAGNRLVIEGPPGTGKSQTIANLIATLSARGKRVLFVAEKRAAIDAVLDRLRDKGIGDLVMDLHDGPGAKRKLAEDLKRALDAAAAARPVDLVAEQSELARQRQILVEHNAELHQIREPWGVSAYQLQTAIIGIPQTARSEQRLRSTVLTHMTAEVYRQASHEVSTFVGLGGVSLWATNSPWLPVLAAGTVTTPEAAQQVAEVMVAVTTHTLPNTRQRFEKSLASVGLGVPQTIAQWASVLEMLRLVERSQGFFDESVFGLDFDRVLADLAPASGGGAGRAWHRMFDGAYRSALRQVRATSKDPKISGSNLVAGLKAARALLLQWRRASVNGNLPRVPSDYEATKGAHHQLLLELGHLEQVLCQGDLEELSPDALTARLRTFIDDRATLNRLPELHRLLGYFQSVGLDPLIKEMQTRNMTAEQATACLAFVWCTSVLELLEIQQPVLGNFEGETHGRIVAQYRERDRAHIGSTPRRIRRLVAENIIRVRDAHPDQSTRVIKEATKKTRYMPVRKLFAAAPDVLTSLKPCWAMSPLVVPQLLPPSLCFDVVIFDEASQVTPESAVGALMRAPQAVVAGDPKQLPPTRFFASGSTLDEEEQEEYADLDISTAMTRDFDSILGVMTAVLPPVIGTKRLLWHYRSRDERLIAFSNSQPHLYDWSLITFPGSSSDKVISHTLVPFQPGRVGQEDSVSDEVEAVVEAVAKHAREHPDESLGVITMSIKHKNRVDEALRRARKDDAELDDYMDTVFGDSEKFFVKNLERVQGDERDSIILSTGYGKNLEGRMRHTFGPINMEGGERRLNVAVTRARIRMKVISSFSSNDLDPAKLRSVGSQMLRDYLRYAESGGADLGTRIRESTPLNPFERDVFERLTAAGLHVDCQVGCSDFWIDFAIKDPHHPGRYVLAVEADGATYHSSETARDRDRLRQDHLERLGWRFCRIWSTDWFHHREREVARVVAAFQEALTAPATDPTSPSASSTTRSDIGAPKELASKRAATPRKLPQPWSPDGRPITEYRDVDLVNFMRWIMSDDVPRTTEELVAIGTKELGFERRGSRIVTALEKAINRVKTEQERHSRSSS